MSPSPLSDLLHFFHLLLKTKYDLVIYNSTRTFQDSQEIKTKDGKTQHGLKMLALLPFSPGNPGVPAGPGEPGCPGVPMTPISPLTPMDKRKVKNMSPHGPQMVNAQESGKEEVSHISS